MRDNFTKAINFLLKWEGYMSNHRADTGGLTIFGISSKFYPKEVERMAKVEKDHALEMAKDIYLKDYWVKSGCDDLEYPFDLIVFDSAVQHGVGKAKTLLSESKDHIDYLFKRINYYLNIVKAKPNQRVFLVGWVNRVVDLYNYITTSQKF